MSAGKWIKRLTQMATAETLVVQSVEKTAKHIQMFVAKEDGTNRQLVLCSASPSDHRVEKKIRAQFRRVARGEAPGR